MKDPKLRIGLDPKPTNLTQNGGHLDPATTFWIIKHGIAMSAMPAWGRTHDDRSLWALTAFVEKLPTLSAQDYGKMIGQSAESTRKASDAKNAP